MEVSDTSVARAAEAAARISFGRLVAILAARSGDVAGAEDALGDALLIALQRWPTTGVPANPEAWLLTAARHRWLDGVRHRAVQDEAVPSLLVLMGQLECGVEDGAAFPDDRLGLLCACAHPAIDVALHAPLMLQAVLGIDAARIASAYLVSPSAMTKRLTRAKQKIKAAGIGFLVPPSNGLRSRLDSVLRGLYAAYGVGWDDLTVGEPQRAGLAAEAVWVARVVAQLCPDPEALGLLALMLFCEARRGARRDASGAFVPLDKQDVGLWSNDLAEEAEALLRRASGAAQLGPFQLEAAIQAVHVDRRRTGLTDWPAILHLYDGLLASTPTLGAAIAQAAAMALSGDPLTGLMLLDRLDQSRVANHQPYWATRAHLTQTIGDLSQAETHYQRAIGLTKDPALRHYLTQAMASLETASSLSTLKS